VTAAERQARADAADALCSAAFARAVGGRADDDTGIALVAVGGYGRRELAPHSDLDVVLVHLEDVGVDEVASQVWYPLWDAGAAIDHSVRALPEVAAVVPVSFLAPAQVEGAGTASRPVPLPGAQAPPPGPGSRGSKCIGPGGGTASRCWDAARSAARSRPSGRT